MCVWYIVQTVTNISNVQPDGQQIQMSTGAEVSTDGQIQAGQLVNTAALASTNMDNILDTRSVINYIITQQ